MYVIGPADIIDQYVGQLVDADGDGSGVTVGEPVYEEESVTDRRAYVSHPMTEDEKAHVEAVLFQNGHLDLVDVQETLPSDWRWQEAL